MSKRYELVNPLQPGPSQVTPAKTDWTKCVICQTVTTESLQCPGESKCPDAGAGFGYSTLASNITRFNEFGELPVDIKVGRLDDGNGIEAAFLENKAKWHKSCHIKFNSTKLHRAEKRKPATSECDPDSATSNKYTRQSNRHEVQTRDVCFFCDDQSASEREASTFRLDCRVRKCALDLQDERLQS